LILYVRINLETVHEHLACLRG